jgi:phospholipid/cholesterol/gamma-HCH transport system permease protein
MPESVDIPGITVRTGNDGTTISARGSWIVRSLARRDTIDRLERQFSELGEKPQATSWDLSGIAVLDHLGAQFFWNAWGKARPAKLVLGPRQEEMFDRLFHLGEVAVPQSKGLHFLWIRALGVSQIRLFDHVVSFIAILGQLVLDLLLLLRHPRSGPWLEISANVYRAGAQAVGITALVGFLIGIVLSYLSAQQLKTFGADVYLVNILGMAVIRELGPVLAAILVAGRSGSAITAQLGVMRVTEELDALLVMGIPHGYRLIMPRVIGLSIAMPLLVIWTDAAALLGGMSAAKLSLGLSFTYFVKALPNAVPLSNLWLGVGKGITFGVLIALTACHFGLRILPNTQSLGEGTTSSVVTSITVVILADAIIAVVFKNVGF